MQTLDLKKSLKHLYVPPSKAVVLVDVPAFNFARVDGEIEPGASPGTSPAFQQAMGALYGIAYTLKFTSKLRKVDPIDYPVMALEALWWSDEGEFDLTQANSYAAFPGGWKWTAMILQPDHITQDMFQEGLAQLRKKRENPAIERLRLDLFQQGVVVQIMHIRPYSTEPATIARMHAFANEGGYRLRGRPHEIYFGDPRRSAPEKLKTVLRQPIE